MACTFGQIDGYPPGSEFGSRSELREVGVYTPNQAGISGTGGEGAESLIVSVGDEDDIDDDDVIFYMGAHGRDPNTRKQVADQKLSRGNLGLARSSTAGLPVRLVRGAEARTRCSPDAGYRYDGLYFVERYWRERGRSGFQVWRYRLVRDDGFLAPRQTPPAIATQTTPRREATTQRIVSNTDAAARVKELHSHRCQVCGIRLDTPGGPYAERAPVRPLGAPHDGPDVESSILCLSPNHHAHFDHGAFTIADSFAVYGIDGSLRTHEDHNIDVECLLYHPRMFGEVTVPCDQGSA